MLWPSSGGMKYPKNFNAAILDSVGHDVRVMRDDQFPCASYSSGPTQMRMIFQLLDADENMSEEGFGADRTFLGDVIRFIRQIG